MFLNSDKNKKEAKGYHVSDTMKLRELESFLNSLPASATVIEILYTGVVCTVVYKI